MNEAAEIHDETQTGHCLCGDISLTISAPLEQVLHCHCENCRRISGNFVAAARVSNEDLDVADPKGRLDWHRFPYARYGFCRGCGSTLFFVAAEHEDRTSVMVGALDDDAGIPLGEIWFADEAQLHNTPLTDVPQFAGNSEAAET